jgi:hypothetical protein
MKISVAQAPIAPIPFDVSVLDRPLNLGDRLRLTVMRYVSRHPKLVWFDPLRLMRSHVLHEAHRDGYDLIVDGYPRSANSFLAMAFKVANPQVRVRSHCHWPTHVIAALRRGKPACVLIRQPEDAIASTAVHTRGTLAWATRRYVDYYEALLPYRDRMLVITFDQATTRLRDVFEEMNQRFGLTLNLPVVDDDFRHAIEEQVRTLDWGQDPLKVSLPSPARAPHLKELKRRLQAPGMALDLHRADELYDLFATCPTALGGVRRGV